MCGMSAVTDSFLVELPEGPDGGHSTPVKLHAAAYVVRPTPHHHVAVVCELHIMLLVTHIIAAPGAHVQPILDKLELMVPFDIVYVMFHSK